MILLNCSTRICLFCKINLQKSLPPSLSMAAEGYMRNTARTVSVLKLSAVTKATVVPLVRHYIASLYHAAALFPPIIRDTEMFTTHRPSFFFFFNHQNNIMFGLSIWNFLEIFNSVCFPKSTMTHLITYVQISKHALFQ